MQVTVTLRGACARAVPNCLHALAQLALDYRSPQRPHCDTLVVLRMHGDMFHPSVKPCSDLQSWGIYSRRPSVGCPLGERRLGATVHLHQGCAPNGEGEGERKGCCTSCRRKDLRLYLTLTEGFPLTTNEVLWFLYDYFDMHDLAGAVIPDSFSFLASVSEEHEQQLMNGGAQHRAAGAPVLQTNEWLYEQIRALTDPRRCSHLRDEYIARYSVEKGSAPEDPDKSFREAVRRVLRRLHQERSQERSKTGATGEGHASIDAGV